MRVNHNNIIIIKVNNDSYPFFLSYPSAGNLIINAWWAVFLTHSACSYTQESSYQCMVGFQAIVYYRAQHEAITRVGLIVLWLHTCTQRNDCGLDLGITIIIAVSTKIEI